MRTESVHLAPPDLTSDAIIAKVSKSVLGVTQAVLGNIGQYPLLVAVCVQRALASLSVKSSLYYGKASWIEIAQVDKDDVPVWAGNFTEERPHFWVETAFHEKIDLARWQLGEKRAPDEPTLKWNPPLLWSRDLPPFFQFQAMGHPEIDLGKDEDNDFCKQIFERLDQALEKAQTLDFPDEAILVSNWRLLDDSKQSFAHFDRSLKVHGLPPHPLHIHH